MTDDDKAHLLREDNLALRQENAKLRQRIKELECAKDGA